MSGSAETRSEQFADALVNGVMHPVDDELRRELAIVDLLVAARDHVRPDAAERDRMLDRIMAGLGIDENAAQDTGQDATAAEPAPTAATAATVVVIDRRRRSMTTGMHARLLVAAAASLCLLTALSAMSLVLARDALPGDALYGVKRSAESAELGMTFGDEPRGFKHLEFATARVNEVEAIAARAGGLVATGDDGRFLTALRAFDTDAAAGSRLLVESATNGDGHELTTLADWAQQQHQRLASARSVMPERSASRAAVSLGLLDRVTARSAALRDRLACLAVTTGGRDEVGLLPATSPCEPAGTTTAEPGAPPNDRGRPGATQSGGPVMTMPPAADQESTAPLDPLNPLDPLDPGSGDPGSTDSAGPTTTTTAPSTSGPIITVPLPLPLLPPITVPPLLPGLGLPGLQLG